MYFVQTAGWIACAIYATIPSFWLLIHPHAHYWRKRKSPYRAVVPAWMGMWVVAALVTAPFRRVALYSTAWTFIPALAFLSIGLFLYSVSGKDFSATQLGGIPELIANHKDQRLVISGIRGRLRHPVYVAHLCEMLAWSIATGLAVCFALTAFAMTTGFVMIQMEDRELEQRFGDEFRTYRNSVPALVPGMRRK